MFTNTSNHSAADQRFIDGLSTLLIYQPIYITANAKIFINHDWIDINTLRRFIIDKYEIPSPNSCFQIPMSIEVAEILFDSDSDELHSLATVPLNEDSTGVWHVDLTSTVCHVLCAPHLFHLCGPQALIEADWEVEC
ncbi:hypothetical protein DFH09DRAFT_1334013 [Mycena vulgaris]|nr:hypothetical protein DFH09DRAFT_1334013 [Mycena vulgaris]